MYVSRVTILRACGNKLTWTSRAEDVSGRRSSRDHGKGRVIQRHCGEVTGRCCNRYWVADLCSNGVYLRDRISDTEANTESGSQAKATVRDAR